MSGTTRTVFRDMRLAASPEALWPFVSDTARINAALGHPARRLLAVSDDGLDYRSQVLEGSNARFAVERPGEWVQGQWWRLAQRLETGPLASSRVTLFLQRDGHGTRARYTLEATPRGPLGRMMIGNGFLDEALDAVEDVLNGIVAHLAGARARPFELAQGPALTQARRLDLAASLAESPHGGIRGADFIDFLLRGHDVETGLFRPADIARRFKVERGAALGLCLAAVRAGLAEPRLQVVCPACQSVAAHARALEHLPDMLDCGVCGVETPLDLSAHVEAAFLPAEPVRQQPLGEHCLTGPRQTPQCLVQQIMEPAERRSFPLVLTPGHYRARTGAAHFSDIVRLEAGARVITLPGTIVVEPTLENGEIVFENHRSETVLSTLERVGTAPGRTTGAALVASQAFRDLFPEAEAPGRTGVAAGVASILHLRSTDPDSELLPDPLRALATALDGALVDCDGESATMLFRASSNGLRAGLKLTGVEADKPPEAIAVGLDTGPVSIGPGPGLPPLGPPALRARALCAVSSAGVMLVAAATFEDPETARIAARLKGREARVSLSEDGTETVWMLGQGDEG